MSVNVPGSRTLIFSKSSVYLLVTVFIFLTPLICKSLLLCYNFNSLYLV